MTILEIILAVAVVALSASHYFLAKEVTALGKLVDSIADATRSVSQIVIDDYERTKQDK
jgi:hypothetical protein